MKKWMAVCILSIELVMAGCGGGGDSGSQNQPANSNVGSSEENLNGALYGKLYYNQSNHYVSVDLATGEQTSPFSYDMNEGSAPTPSWDGTEFAQVFPILNSGYEYDYSMVFTDSAGQVTGQREIIARLMGTRTGAGKIGPNNRFVIYDWQDGGQSGTVVFDRDSTWERDFGRTNFHSYTWTSDGKIVFAVNGTIYKVDDIISGPPIEIATIPIAVYELRVSPDGSRIAFWGSPGGSFTDGHIYMINIDGSDYHQVSDSNLWESGVAWSPDGNYLAVVRGSSIVNIPSGGPYDSTIGNVNPDVFVFKSDARNLNISEDWPKDAVHLRDVDIDQHETLWVRPFSPIYWLSN